MLSVQLKEIINLVLFSVRFEDDQTKVAERHNLEQNILFIYRNMNMSHILYENIFSVAIVQLQLNS